MLKLKRILCYLLILYSIACNGKSVCSSNICKNNKQLCKFQQSQSPAKHCLNFEKLIKGEYDKKILLDKINSRRNKVAAGELRSFPSSNSVMKLEWNHKLELSAQRWVNQCVKHSSPDIKDACRHLDDMEVGQNIGSIYGESPGLVVTALVDIWYMELLNANGSILPRFKNSLEGGTHYDYFTQLVWASTTDVGCGSAKFQERLQDHEGRNRTVYRLVCNFSPSGNIKDHPVYTHGDPCSRCPNGTSCDAVYTALCSKQETSTVEEKSTNTEIVSLTTLPNYIDNVTKSDDDKEKVKTKSTEVFEEENFTPFDFLSHLNNFTKQSIILTTAKEECKDIAVEVFIDILRKKLTNDHNFKEMLISKVTQGIPDALFSDPNVDAFAKKIYSKIEPSTTVKSTESVLLNSTLLVDLVEAVIFRNSGATSHVIELSTQIISDVHPIKVQAELAQIQQNEDFTGHYFFPEDEDTTTEVTESSESYYDTPNLSISDVIMEIEDIKKNAGTRNFLDDILDMESSTEETTTLIAMSPDDLNVRKTGHEVMKKFLEDIKEKSKEN